MCHTEKTELPRIAIVGSGTGSNARAILESVQRGELSAEVTLILTDVPGAGILRVAAEHGIPSVLLEPGPGKRGCLSAKAIAEMSDLLESAGVDLVVLAGFMRIIREPLLSLFPGKILNIHPSLLPKYPGLHTVKRAMSAGEKETGCTIHIVDSGIDTGEILHQEKVSIDPEDTLETVTEKIHAAEHQAYPMVIGRVLGN